MRNKITGYSKYELQYIIKENYLALFGVLCYYLIFIITYKVVISPVHSYAGLIDKQIPLWCWLFSITLSALPVFMINKNLIRPSDFAIWILYFFVIIPSTVIPFFVLKNDPVVVILLPLTMIISFLLMIVIRNSLALPRINNDSNIYLLKYMLPVFVVIVSLLIFYLANFKINLSLADVYTRRISARETVQAGSFIAYFTSALNKVAIPMCIILGIQYKKIFYLALGLLGTIAIFSLQGTKSTLFTPLVIIIVLIFFKLIKKKGFAIVSYSICIFFIFSIIEYLTIRSSIIATLFIRREMIIPAQLTSYYWDYFSYEPFIYLGDSILQWIPEANNVQSVGKLIGFEYFSNPEQNANVNIWASGFAQFGYVGMICASFGAGVILNILDRVGKKEKYIPACAAGCIIGLVYTNSAFLTSLVSSGTLLLIGLIAYYPLNEIGDEKWFRFKK